MRAIRRRGARAAKYRPLATRPDAFARERVRAELAELCAGTHAGRADRDAVTLFKSVGTALEDLCAARLVARMRLAT